MNSKKNNTLYPVPIVRLIVPDASGRVLLLKRSNTSYAPGMWCLPGGKVDYGITVEEACLKELSEETGMHSRNVTFLFYQDSLPLSPGHMHCINLYFKCTAQGEIVINAESSDFAWVGPETIQNFEIVFNNEQGLMSYWKNFL